MDSAKDTLSGGLPHSEIPGSTIARISPGLFAACHVLHRLSVPRHPPDALTLTLHRKTRRSKGQSPGSGVRNQESDIRKTPARPHATMSRMKTLSGSSQPAASPPAQALPTHSLFTLS